MGKFHGSEKSLQYLLLPIQLQQSHQQLTMVGTLKKVKSTSEFLSKKINRLTYLIIMFTNPEDFL